MGRPTLLEPGSLVGAPAEAAGAAPIDYIAAWLRRRMPELHAPAGPLSMSDRVLVVRSETGSGKSTVLPAAIFGLLRGPEAGRSRYRGRSVLCAQPRVLTAVALAQDLAASPHFPDLRLGETVGFQTGPFKESPVRGLIYATVGVLQAQLRTQSDAELIDRYAFIVLDEAHERSLDMEVTLMLLKRFMLRNLGNPRLPFLLLASATIDPALYAGYLGVPHAGPSRCVVEVTGRRFPVEVVWPEHGTNDYPRAAVEAVRALHAAGAQDPPGRADVLVFMPGAREIQAVARGLEALNAELARAGRPLLLPLQVDREAVNSRNRDFVRVRAPAAELRVKNPVSGAEVRPGRRVVISTVVAETGLTIETLGYVVDPGWSREVECYQPGALCGLLTKPAAQSRLEQRKGRVGRLFPGVYLPLYTRGTHARLRRQQQSEVVTAGLGDVFMGLAGERFRADRLDLLEPPPADAVAAAQETALLCGLLDAGGAPTAAGRLQARLARTGMAELRLFLAAAYWRASADDAVTALAVARAVGGRGLAALAAVPGSLDLALQAGLPPGLGLTGAEARRLLADDFLEGLLLAEAFRRAVAAADADAAQVRRRCEELNLHHDRMVEVLGLRQELMEDLLQAGLNPFAGRGARLADQPREAFAATAARFKRCLVAAFRQRLLAPAGVGAHADRHGNAYSVAASPAAAAAPGAADALLVSSGAWLRPAGKRLSWAPHPGLVSVLDGRAAADARDAQEAMLPAAAEAPPLPPAAAGDAERMLAGYHALGGG